MTVILSAAFFNVLMTASAVFGVLCSRRNGVGHVAGLMALFSLPLMNLAFFWWLLSGIPFFPQVSPAGISFAITGGVSVIGAIVAFVGALLTRRRSKADER